MTLFLVNRFSLLCIINIIIFTLFHYSLFYFSLFWILASSISNSDSSTFFRLLRTTYFDPLIRIPCLPFLPAHPLSLSLSLAIKRDPILSFLSLSLPLHRFSPVILYCHETSNRSFQPPQSSFLRQIHEFHNPLNRKFIRHPCDKYRTPSSHLPGTPCRQNPNPPGLGGEKIQRHLAPTLHVAHHRSNSPSLIVSSILDSLLAILENRSACAFVHRIGCVKTDHPRSTAFSSSIGNLRGSVIGPRLGHPPTLVGFCKI